MNQKSIQKVTNNQKDPLIKSLANKSLAKKDEMKDRIAMEAEELSREEAKSPLKESQSKRELEEIERKYMEEGYDSIEDSLESSIKLGKYNFLDGLTESKAMEAMINRLYAEMPDLQNSCEISQQENPPAIYCNDSVNDSEDLCNYGLSPMVNGKSPVI